MQDLSPGSQSLYAGVAAGATFSAAMGAAGLLVGPGGLPILAAALGASCILAGLQWGLGLASPFERVEFTRTNAVYWLLSMGSALLCLSLLAYAVPVGSLLSCQPLVPWRISIAVFGAFASAAMVTGLGMRLSTARYQPLVHVGLGWIAPFYGFFHAPWFLAQTLALPCADRPVTQGLIAAATMLVAAYAGARVAIWIFDRED